MNPRDRINTLRKHVTRLRARSASAADELTLAPRLGQVEGDLCNALVEEGQLAEVRTFLQESLKLWATFAQRHPGDETARSFRVEHLYKLADVSDRMGRAQDSLNHLKYAVGLIEQDPKKRSADCLRQLRTCRRYLGWLMYRRGDRGGAKSLLIANAKGVETTDAVSRFCTQIDLRVLEEAEAVATKSEKSARPAAGTGPFPQLKSPTDALQLPDHWAQLAMSALASGDRADPARAARGQSENVYAAMRYLAFMTSQLLQMRAFDAARRTADKMLALGKEVVKRHGDQPFAHLALSVAYSQRYQSAYETKAKDEPAIDEHMKRALQEARAACLLDPDCEPAHHEAYLLERRLSALLAKK
jgi:hypothetical protein